MSYTGVSLKREQALESCSTNNPEPLLRLLAVVLIKVNLLHVKICEGRKIEHLHFISAAGFSTTSSALHSGLQFST